MPSPFGVRTPKACDTSPVARAPWGRPVPRATSPIDRPPLFRPGRALDDVHEVAPLVARHEAFEDIGLDVAEGGLRPGRDAVGERLEDGPLEVGPRVQRGDLRAVGVADVVVSD